MAWRRGVTAQEGLVLGAALALLGGVGVYVAPRAIEAATSGNAPAVAEVIPDDPARADFCAAFRGLIESSISVLGLWENARTGGFELLLWASDDDGTGSLDTDEALLLSYSPALGAVTAYLAADAPSPDMGLGVEVENAPADAGAARPIRRVLDATFPDWWRAREGVERRVIGAGLRLVRVETRDGGGGATGLVVELVWPPGVADSEADRAVFAAAPGGRATPR